MKEIYEWLLKEREKHLPSSGMIKAIDYGVGRWKQLTAFLTCLALPLTNNDAERALRHSVLGRKNFAGSKSIDGADTAATLYTIIESCKKANLQPRNYLKYLITERWHKREPLSPLRYLLENIRKTQKAQSIALRTPTVRCIATIHVLISIPQDPRLT